MEVIKRSELCARPAAVKKNPPIRYVKDIRMNTTFTGTVGSYDKEFVWLRTQLGIVRLSEGGDMGAAYHILAKELTVSNYEVLDVALVIND